MSAGSDDIFARWSRRKQAVRETEVRPPDEGKGVPEALAPQVDAEPPGPDEPFEPSEPAEPLPRLEDLTAESDLSAFLREGVPQALKSAAMRKMWSLDPTIRDYIGPSEYAWNFNEPGSMAGFGPLENAGEHVAAFLSTMSDRARSRLETAAASEIPQQRAAGPEEEAREAPADEDDVAPSREEPPPERPEMPVDPELSSPEGVPVTEPGDAARPGEPKRPRHGRAMPR